MWLPLSLIFLLSSLTQASDVNGTVYYVASSSSYIVQLGILDPTGVAYATFADTLNVTGWGVFELKSNGTYKDSIQMYGAGVLEGVLTAPRIWQAHINMLPVWPNNATEAPDELVQFLNDNDQWVRQQIAALSASDPFWNQIGMLYQQLEGLYEGYNNYAKTNNLQSLSYLDLIILQATCDMGYILQHLFPDLQPDWPALTPTQFEDANPDDHCSVLIKLTPDYSELYLAHDTWTQYSYMNRIYYHFYLDLQDPNVKAKGTSFSGYPGVLYSIDDFYMTSAGLTVTETTNNVYNNTEFGLISSKNILTWARIRAANALANSGRTWANFASINWMGTYTNQWMVLDYKLFTSGQPLQPNTLWVLEEIPSRVHSEDLTQYLERGDWRSYNVAFFPDIYNISEYPMIVSSQGNDFSYDLAPRAKIMRRDVGNVSDLDSLKHFMLYNEFQTDPFSEGNPHYAISSRRDLDVTNPLADGGIDTKITNSQLIKNLTAITRAGPTTQDQPPFKWTSTFPNPHLGQPEVFNFDWVTMKPTFSLNQ